MLPDGVAAPSDGPAVAAGGIPAGMPTDEELADDGKLRARAAEGAAAYHAQQRAAMAAFPAPLPPPAVATVEQPGLLQGTLKPYQVPAALLPSLLPTGLTWRLCRRS